MSDPTPVALPDSPPVLYGSGTSPFVRKVRVAMLEKRIDHRFELCSVWTSDTPVRRLHPLQKVPVLHWPGRGVLTDSRVIVQALDVFVPDQPLWPHDPERRLEALQLEALADGVADATALYTQEGWREASARSAYWSLRQRDKVTAGIEALEGVIARWLPDEKAPLPLVPIAVGAALEFASFWIKDLDWRAASPQLDELTRRLDLRASWQSRRPAVPPGVSFPRL